MTAVAELKWFTLYRYWLLLLLLLLLLFYINIKVVIEWKVASINPKTGNLVIKK